MKQWNIPWLGAFMESFFVTLPLLSVINFWAIITVLYTTVRPHLLQYAPWVTMWLFVGCITLLGIIGMVLVYKFVLPSIWTFRQDQMFKHNSNIVDLLKNIDERLARLEESSKGDEEGSGTASIVQ